MRKFILLSLTLALGQAGAAYITNGGFEAGLTGWTIDQQVGSAGAFQVQTGTTSPATGATVPAPTEGWGAAMTDAEGPGSYALYQTFTIPATVMSAVLRFDLYIANEATDFVSPDTLDFATPALNQQARVDILRAGADPFSVDAADILLNVFRTMPGDPLASGYNTYSVDITSLVNANAGTPLVLRFAEADNVNFFRLGVDNVDIVENTVPEPSTWMATAVVLAAICRCRHRFIRNNS